VSAAHVLRRRAASMALVAALLHPLAGSAARAQGAGLPARASVSPGRVRLGEPAVYRGIVLVPRTLRARWVPADTGGAFTWGPLVASRSADRRRVPPALARDTLRVETTLQAFALGAVRVPGLGFVTGDGAPHRLPTLTLLVAPIVPPRDSTLKPVRGPLAAPWWERVPWRWVIAGVLALIALVGLVRAIRRRRARPALQPVVARDPGRVALEELAALRRLGLPEQERFGEHAFHLTRIVRRWLEATQGALHPGDTTRELTARLAATAFARDELSGLSALLSAFDRVKFARAPSSVDEAHRAEQAVESLVRRLTPAPLAPDGPTQSPPGSRAA
jgi:hypothetical protein